MTPAQIFLKPSEYRQTLPSFREVRNYPYLFRPEFLSAVESEVNWIRQPITRPEIPLDQYEAVGLGRVECPTCRGCKSYQVPLQGEITGIDITETKECGCQMLAMFWRRWDKTPARFRNVANLKNLTPSAKSLMSMTRQAEIIDTIRKRPLRSYLLHGAAGTGKTHLAASLYRTHLERWATAACNMEYHECPVWRLSAPVLLEQWVQKSVDKDAPKPDLSEREITNAGKNGHRPVLFLDEVDKVRSSDFKMEKLRSIIDAVYEAEGQIVATSNASPADIAQRWGGEWGDIILRRIAAPPEGMVIQFEVG